MFEFLKDPKFLVSMTLLGIGAACVFLFPKSNPHMILGTNLVTGVGGYWIGTSISSYKKDENFFKSLRGGSNEHSG